MREKTEKNSRRAYFTANIGCLSWEIIAAAVSLILFFYPAYQVYRGEPVFFDGAIREAVRGIAAPPFTRGMIWVSFFGSFRFLTGAVIFVVVALIRFKQKRAIVPLLLAVGTESVLEVTFKSFFRRPRPQPFFDYPPLESFSFPSGHALASLCFYGILAWLVGKHLKARGAKMALWALTAAWVLLISFSRIYLGVHYPSDVLAGLAAGFVVIMAVVSVDLYLEKNGF